MNTSISDDEPPAYGIFAAIRRHASTRPNDAALITPRSEALSYSRLARAIEAAAITLRNAGLGATARIGIALPYSPEAVLTMVSIACNGVAVPIDPRLTVAELEERLAALGLNAIVLQHGLDSAARCAAERTGLPILEMVPFGANEIGATLLPQFVPAAAAAGEPSPDSPAFVLQTSGTTAIPKLVPFTHRNMLAAAKRLQNWFGLTKDDRSLCVAPTYHSHGLKVTVLTPLITGGSIALPTSQSALALSEWFEELSPT